MLHLMIHRFSVITTTPLKSLGFFKSLRFSSTIAKNNDNPVTVFFENHGFSKSQISVILKKVPHLLSAKPEKSLLPKLLFFQSKGLSSPEVAKLVSCFPYILKRSLNRHLIPSFDYFQGLLQSEEKTVAAIKRFVGLLHCDLRISVRPNVEMLTQIGVSHTTIESFLINHPRLFSISSIQFKEIVEEVKEMGFHPLNFSFVRAVSALASMSKSTWENKVEVYRKWGWTEEVVLSAFRKHPGCMMASEDKINGVMDFFVNQMGCESSFVARNPTLVTLSLKGRIVPRGSVYQVLLSKGLIEKHEKLLLLFYSTEKRFLNNFIEPHKKRAPGLLNLYEEALKVYESKEV